MKTKPILVCLGGSLRPVSYSLAACKTVAEMAIELGMDAEVLDLKELSLPMYVPDVPVADFAPQSQGLERLIRAYQGADLLVWVSPTYHGTISGVFKNAIDFAELLAGDTPPYFQHRALGLVSVNDSTTFAAMRDCAKELRAWLAPTQVELYKEDFDADLNVSGDRARRQLHRMVSELASFALDRD